MQYRVVIKVSELSKREKEQEYAEKVRMANERIEHQEIMGVEEKWKDLRDTVLECDTEVCGCRRVGQGTRNGSEWWNDKVRIAVLQKRKVFEEWLKKRTEQSLDEYNEGRRRVKAVVRGTKR